MIRNALTQTLLAISAFSFIGLVVIAPFGDVYSPLYACGVALFAILVLHNENIENWLRKAFKNVNLAMLVGWIIWIPLMILIAAIVGAFKEIGNLFLRAKKDIIE